MQYKYKGNQDTKHNIKRERNEIKAGHLGKGRWTDGEKYIVSEFRPIYTEISGTIFP